MKRWLIPLTIPLVIGASYFTVFKHQTYFNNHESASPSLFSGRNNSLPKPAFETSTKDIGSGQLNTQKQNLIGELAFRLRKRYGNSIRNISTQSSLIVFKRQLRIREKEHGEKLFDSVVYRAFPKYAPTILRVVQLLEIYNDWLTEHNYFRDLEELSRQEELWNKRHQLFGSDAEIIWENNFDSETKKQFNLQDTIHQIDASQTLSYEDRLSQLIEAIAYHYYNSVKNTPPPPLLSNVFFSLDSIQLYLRSLSEEKRQDTIKQTRKKLGFNQAQIQKLAEEDALNNKLWELGKIYTKEKAKIDEMKENNTLKKHEALQESRKLRVKYFGSKAGTIEQEESLGFRRFEQRQTFGTP